MHNSGQYNYTQITLWSQTAATVNAAIDEGRISEEEAEAHRFEAGDMCLQWAYRATTCMRDFREAHGLKVIPSCGIL